MDAMKNRLDSSTPLPPSKEKTVLLAPSWGESAILSKFGSDIIESLLRTNHHIIIRPHPQSFTSEKELLESLMNKYPAGERLEWNRDNDNFDVLRRSDVMISDFSGVMFDFSLVFDKPIIYTDVQYDSSPYDACWLNEEPWTFRILPKLGVKLTQDNLHQLDKIIEQCLNDAEFEEGRKTARKETWAYIGESAVRTTDYLIRKRDELLSSGHQSETA